MVLVIAVPGMAVVVVRVTMQTGESKVQHLLVKRLVRGLRIRSSSIAMAVIGGMPVVV
jgi:hypothetical protein